MATYYGMVKPLLIMLGKVLGEPPQSEPGDTLTIMGETIP
jgi:hypothetical protein